MARVCSKKNEQLLTSSSFFLAPGPSLICILPSSFFFSLFPCCSFAQYLFLCVSVCVLTPLVVTPSSPFFVRLFGFLCLFLFFYRSFILVDVFLISMIPWVKYPMAGYHFREDQEHGCDLANDRRTPLAGQ